MSNPTLTETRHERINRRLAMALRNGMNKQDLTQRELAKRSGVSNSYLSQIMNERANLKFKTIAKLETGLGLNLFSVIQKPDEPFEL